MKLRWANTTETKATPTTIVLNKAVLGWPETAEFTIILIRGALLPSNAESSSAVVVAAAAAALLENEVGYVCVGLCTIFLSPILCGAWLKRKGGRWGGGVYRAMGVQSG